MSNIKHSDDESATGHPVGQDGVSADSERLWDAAFDAAREFIRFRYDTDGCLVGIGEGLDHLDDRFGKDAGLSTDVGTVLSLCTALWEDPHIIQVANGWIEFYWNEQGRPRRDGGVVRDLRDRLSRSSGTGGVQ